MKYELNGVLPLWKPRGMTSFAAVQEVKKIFQMKRAGHTGTLDPEVDGVLPICLGRATKIVEYLTADKKTYLGEVTIGFSTTTEDQTGEIVEERPVDREITEEEVLRVLDELTGEIKQVPPMFSAVKVKGKRLYEYAREGITVERPERTVTIYELSLLSPVEKQEDGTIKFTYRAECSKGTYIRTLSVTIGEKLGYPAHMSKLTRTASGAFAKEDCIRLDDLKNLDRDKQEQAVLSIEKALSDYPKKTIDSTLEEKVLNGAILPFSVINMDEPLIGLYNQQGICLALYEKHPRRHGMLKPAKMLMSIEPS